MDVLILILLFVVMPLVALAGYEVGREHGRVIGAREAAVAERLRRVVGDQKVRDTMRGGA